MNGLDHLVLGAVRTGEQLGLGDNDVDVVVDRCTDLVDVHVVGDVSATVADVHADATPLVRWSRSRSRSRRHLLDGLDVFEVGGDLRDCGPRVQNRIDDVLRTGRRAGDENAGDVGAARVKVLARLGYVVELIEAELARY